MWILKYPEFALTVSMWYHDPWWVLFHLYHRFVFLLLLWLFNLHDLLSWADIFFIIMLCFVLVDWQDYGGKLIIIPIFLSAATLLFSFLTCFLCVKKTTTARRSYEDYYKSRGGEKDYSYYRHAHKQRAITDSHHRKHGKKPVSKRTSQTSHNNYQYYVPSSAFNTEWHK